MILCTMTFSKDAEQQEKRAEASCARLLLNEEPPSLWLKAASSNFASGCETNFSFFQKDSFQTLSQPRTALAGWSGNVFVETKKNRQNLRINSRFKLEN